MSKTACSVLSCLPGVFNSTGSFWSDTVPVSFGRNGLSLSNMLVFMRWWCDCDLIDWLIDWLIDRLIDWLIDWLSDWVIDWLINWLIDWLIDSLIYCNFEGGLLECLDCMLGVQDSGACFCRTVYVWRFVGMSVVAVAPLCKYLRKLHYKVKS